MATIKGPNELLTDHLRMKMRDAGLDPDTYDPDFIFGVFIVWLAENDAVLTGTGVEKA
jgi:hypothetical protein